jgi:hypothetical protein
LLAVRGLLLAHLDVDPDTVRVADLEPAEVGIVGNAAHRGGYHCGKDRVVPNDYSVHESPRDRAGLSSYASALDVGMFSHGSHDLRSFSVWCVGQCKAGAHDTRDIREIIYSPDGKTVKRWDRLGRRTSGDNSHLFHTHFSFFRDATRDGRDLSSLFRRYLTAIGLIKPPTPLEALTMELSDRIAGTDNKNRTVGDVLADLANLRNYLVTPAGQYKGPGAPAPGSPLDLIVKDLSK